jgi:hypothetical protein
MCLIRQHALFGSPTAPSLLPSYLLMLGPFHIGFAFACSLDFVQQQAASEESVQPLLPGALRLHLEPGWAMCDLPQVEVLLTFCHHVRLTARKTPQVRLLHAVQHTRRGVRLSTLTGNWPMR